MAKKLPAHIDPVKFEELNAKQRDFLLALMTGKYTKTQLKKKFYIGSDRTWRRRKAKVTQCIGADSMASS